MLQKCSFSLVFKYTKSETKSGLLSFDRDACCLLELRPRKLIYTRPAAYISIYAAVCLSVCLSVHIFVCQSSRKALLGALFGEGVQHPPDSAVEVLTPLDFEQMYVY